MSDSSTTMKGTKSPFFPTVEYIRHEALVYFVLIGSSVALVVRAAALYARPIGTLAVTRTAHPHKKDRGVRSLGTRSAQDTSARATSLGVKYAPDCF